MNHRLGMQNHPALIANEDPVNELSTGCTEPGRFALGYPSNRRDDVPESFMREVKKINERYSFNRGNHCDYEVNGIVVIVDEKDCRQIKNEHCDKNLRLRLTLDLSASECRGVFIDAEAQPNVEPEIEKKLYLGDYVKIIGENAGCLLGERAIISSISDDGDHYIATPVSTELAHWCYAGCRDSFERPKWAPYTNTKPPMAYATASVDGDEVKKGVLRSVDVIAERLGVKQRETPL